MRRIEAPHRLVDCGLAPQRCWWRRLGELRRNIVVAAHHRAPPPAARR